MEGDQSVPKVIAKRQITLSIDQCRALGIEPGDEVECFVADGQLTVVKKIQGAAKGLLRHVKPQASLSDEESVQSVLN